MKTKRGGNNTQIYKIYKYDLEGNFVAEFNSLRDVMFIDNLHKPHLISHLKGNYNHYKNFIYSKNYYMKYPKELLPKSKKVYQYDLEGNFVGEFNNPHQIEDKYNVKNIYSHLEGEQKKCGNFIYSYEKKDKVPKWVSPNKILKSKKIVQYNLEGKFIKIHNSIADASKELNIASCIISKICLKKPQSYQSNGFIFRHYQGHKKNLSKSDIVLKTHRKPIIQYTLKGKKIKEYISLTQASKETGITQWIIAHGNGGGFIWKYKE